MAQFHLSLAGQACLMMIVLAGCLLSKVHSQAPPSPTSPPVSPSVLPYISLGSTAGVQREYVGHFDDGVSHAIHIPGGFPFGNLIHSFAYVGTNGIFSFSEPFYTASATPFPNGAPGAYIVAPYWDDVDIRLAGNISYEVHSRSRDSPGSNQLLDEVSSFVEDSAGQSFHGSWMLVAEWKEVHPWPHGLDSPIWALFFPDLVLNNTWQGLMITDGTNSYAVFTYRCGDMNWAYSPTIGFNAAGSSFANHPNTGSSSAEEIACLNSPDSQWYNVVYQISLPNATNQTSLPTIESRQSNYLPFLEFTNSTATSGTLPPCQNCTIGVTVPGNGFPFGSYYHSTIYVGTNGIFSLSQDFHLNLPEPFPSDTNVLVKFAYLVAPYWSNIDTRLDGHVNYEVHVSGESSTSDDYLGRVSSLINSEEDSDFVGSWMIVATWDSVHPFPHGNSAEQDRVDPYLQSVNTFQGILITNGTQSYSVFTYECDQMEWSDEATIGYNAGGEYNASHPLSGTLLANAVDCLHSNINVTINNVIFKLVPGVLNAGSPPSPPSSLGSCINAGYSRCCESGSCLGTNPSDCYCDEYCHSLGDCCNDITTICQVEEPTGNSTYLIFGSLQLLSRVSLTGSNLHVLVHQPNSVVLGVDFDYRRGYLYWSEGISDAMYRSALDGSNIETLLNTGTEVVDDIALDWIGNNLYWTDAFYARIEVMDLDTRHRRELIRTGADTIPRAIAVDPSTRYMYWTDWGGVAKIERASMDGSDRRVLHSTGLTWPNGLTIDYPAQRIYWVDASLDRIEYSNVDGTGRFVLFSGLAHPFSITLEGNLLFWTDWLNDAIHTAHKISGATVGNLTLYNNLRDRPFGIEAVTPTRQAQNVTNPCDGASCLFMCLLSSTSSAGYSCECPDGYELDSDGTNCTFGSTPLPPNAPGSCVAAGYQVCCTSGYCTGSPPNCACDANCYQRRDCCGDVNVTCPTGSCAAAGYRACCTDGSSCLGTEGCFCDSICIFFGDCCYDFEDLCPTNFGSEIGSCAAAGYTACCANGSDCLGAPANCKCDAVCRDHGDCCTDIASTCPLTTTPGINFTQPQTSWLPFLTLRVTPGVTTLSVPAADDGTSSAISIPTGFPIGNSNQSTAYIGTNGVISFQQPFTHHAPSLFPSDLTFISSAFLLAPFWSDIDISIYGSIFYEVHRGGNSSLITQVNHFISNHTESDFTGTWMLVAQWDQVREFPGLFNIPTNTFQAIAITDGSQSYAVYTYRCGDLQWSGGATIGYNGGPVGDFYANHPLSGGQNVNSIACINSGVTEWSNVIYNVSIDVYIPTEPPPTVEPRQSIYLEFLERTSNSSNLRHCDDCVSSAIHLGNNLVPFGDLYHSVAHISSNGIISFGNGFPNFGATLFPNANNPTVFNSYVAAPYWSDIDGRNFGEVWYETHAVGQSATSNSLLERVSNLVRSEQNLSSFQGTWMVVATWNGSVPFAGTGALRNTFQGIVITNRSKTYAVYTYHCDDMQWSDGSVIGFNAGGSYYANHPLSDSTEARDIDCVHSPGSEWNNVVYDLNPNGTVAVTPPPISGWLPFLPLNTTSGVTTLLVPAFDDGSSPAIPVSVPGGFPIGNDKLSVAYIGTNGIISFQQPFTHHVPYLFPSEFTFISSAFLLAPFWSDIDISSPGRGSIKYEVHSGSDDSFLSQVNSFVSNYTGSEFAGTWMLIAYWDQVPQFPSFIATVFNTYQAIAITDGSQSYAVYTYRCGGLQWSGGATIGYNGGPVGEFYANHPLSGGSVNTIACLNSGVTEWSNVVYNISCYACIPTEPPPTVEPSQDVYLEFLERTNNSLTMPRCDDCSSDAIDLSTSPVPFGDYFHYVAHISTNGLISFGQHFPNFEATLLPNEGDSTVFTAFLAAPYWGDIDNRNLGEIWYETHTSGQSAMSDSLLERVSNLVRSEQNLSSFQGTWMVVATWNGSVPFAGSGALRNTFQGIVITNSSKTYAVYTYHCDDVQWSDGSVIGFNAGGSYYANHPLSDSIEARDIDCVHSPGSEWNNVVYDLNPNGTTNYGPPVLSGSCVLAGYTECCNDSVCIGHPVEDCYCDSTCHLFGDCCGDINITCPAAVIHPSEVSLIVAQTFGIVQLSIDGSTAVSLTQLNPASFYIGLDYDYRNNLVYFSDVRSGLTMLGRVSFNGSVPSQVLTTVQYGAVEDLAVDWIANNLYWTDSYYNHLEVFDLDTMFRAELLRTGAHTAPRAIVVDPNARYMYWSDWGEPAKIERASMDGSNRTVLHNTGLMWPNGLAIDYQLKRLYWADAFTDRIEYSSFDGTGREILLTVVSGLHHPFSITISGDQVYWTDWANFTIYTAHKQSPISILPVYNFFLLPNGIEAVDSNRQLGNITNYCEGSPCSHLCLLSASSPTNYTCACPEGSSPMEDGVTCTQITNVTVLPPSPGSCAAAGYTGCCNGGYCAGYPPNCFCEPDCVSFRDCCHDFNTTCSNPVTSLPTSQPTSPPQTTSALPPTFPTSPPQTSPSIPPTTSHPTSLPTNPPQTTSALPPTFPTSPPETGSSPTTLSTSQPTSMPETTQTVPPTTTHRPIIFTLQTAPHTPESTTTMQPVVAVPPGPVINLSAFPPEDSDSILIVAWLPPDEPSGPLEILHYNMVVTNYSMAPVANVTVPVDQTSTNVTGLGPFIPYFVSVSAVSAIGEGIVTSVLNFTREGAPPVSPSNVKVDKLDSGTKISVSWDPLTPEQAWGFVTNYTISYTKEGEPQKRQTSEKTVPGTDNSTVIEGLDPNQDYSVSVRGDTKAGVGKMSEPASTKVPVSTNANRGSQGGVIAGGLIAVVVALVVLALAVLAAVCLIKRRARKKANSYTMFDDSTSLSSSTSGDFRPRMDSYQQTGMFKKKQKKEELAFSGENGNGTTDSYNPTDALPSFDNPVYTSSPASDSAVLLDGFDNPVYEDVKDIKLDQYEVPKQNPYEFS